MENKLEMEIGLVNGTVGDRLVGLQGDEYEITKKFLEAQAFAWQELRRAENELIKNGASPLDLPPEIEANFQEARAKNYNEYKSQLKARLGLFNHE